MIRDNLTMQVNIEARASADVGAAVHEQVVAGAPELGKSGAFHAVRQLRHGGYLLQVTERLFGERLVDGGA